MVWLSWVFSSKNVRGCTHVCEKNGPSSFSSKQRLCLGVWDMPEVTRAGPPLAVDAKKAGFKKVVIFDILEGHFEKGLLGTIVGSLLGD